MTMTTAIADIVPCRLDRPPWPSCKTPKIKSSGSAYPLRWLATLGLILFHGCSSCDGYIHHRWRHRDPSDAGGQDYHSLCSRCPPGFGVARRCTQVQDTLCHSCPEGHYATSYSRKHPCWPCSHCGEGLYEAHPCTSTADTICDACSNQHLHAANGDYDRKCRDWAASQQRNLLAAGAVVHASKSHAETRTSRLHDADAAPLDLDDADDVDGDEEGDNDGEGGRRRHRDRDRSRDRDRHRDRHRDRSVATRYDDSRSGVEKLPPATGDVFTHEFTQIDEDTNDEEVAVGVAQLAAFQVVLIFTAVAAILALTCRLRVCSSHETTRLKLTEGRDDGVALIEQLTES